MGSHEQKKGSSSGRVSAPPVVAGAPIPNFRQVNSWFYRGGQPNPDGLHYLSELKVRTIVSLRWSSSVIDQERLAAKAFGINYVSIPLNYWTYPSSKQIDQFLSILDDKDMHPVYLHCKHGSDRAGLLVAVYRMAKEGWSADEAYKEMKECGFHLIKMYHFKFAVYLFESRLDKSKKA